MEVKHYGAAVLKKLNDAGYQEKREKGFGWTYFLITCYEGFNQNLSVSAQDDNPNNLY